MTRNNYGIFDSGRMILVLLVSMAHGGDAGDTLTTTPVRLKGRPILVGDSYQALETLDVSSTGDERQDTNIVLQHNIAMLSRERSSHVNSELLLQSEQALRELGSSMLSLQQVNKDCFENILVTAMVSTKNSHLSVGSTVDDECVDYLVDRVIDGQIVQVSALNKLRIDLLHGAVNRVAEINPCHRSVTDLPDHLSYVGCLLETGRASLGNTSCAATQTSLRSDLKMARQIWKLNSEILRRQAHSISDTMENVRRSVVTQNMLIHGWWKAAKKMLDQMIDGCKHMELQHFVHKCAERVALLKVTTIDAESSAIRQIDYLFQLERKAYVCDGISANGGLAFWNNVARHHFNNCICADEEKNTECHRLLSVMDLTLQTLIISVESAHNDVIECFADIFKVVGQPYKRLVHERVEYLNLCQTLYVETVRSMITEISNKNVSRDKCLPHEILNGLVYDDFAVALTHDVKTKRESEKEVLHLEEMSAYESTDEDKVPVKKARVEKSLKTQAILESSVKEIDEDENSKKLTPQKKREVLVKIRNQVVTYTDQTIRTVLGTIGKSIVVAWGYVKTFIVPFFG